MDEHDKRKLHMIHLILLDIAEGKFDVLAIETALAFIEELKELE